MASCRKGYRSDELTGTVVADTRDWRAKLLSLWKVKIVFLACLSGIEAITPVAAKDSVLLLSLGLLNIARGNARFSADHDTAISAHSLPEIGAEIDSYGRFGA
jgi:hypothetical protein